jgi:hypothetical protein
MKRPLRPTTQAIALLAASGLFCAHLEAQEAEPSPTPEEEVEPVTSGFILFTKLLKPAPLKCIIGTNNVVLDATAEPVGSGFTSSLLPWRPARAKLRAEAAGYQPAELSPFLQIGETPVLILQERSPGSLSFSIIKNSENRDGPFYDAINLTKDSSLSVTANGKNIQLPRSKRVRLSSEKRVEFKVEGGPSDVLESMDDPSFLVLFYTGADGKTGFSVVPDMPLQ